MALVTYRRGARRPMTPREVERLVDGAIFGAVFAYLTAAGLAYWLGWLP